MCSIVCSIHTSVDLFMATAFKFWSKKQSFKNTPEKTTTTTTTTATTTTTTTTATTTTLQAESANTVASALSIDSVESVEEFKPVPVKTSKQNGKVKVEDKDKDTAAQNGMHIKPKADVKCELDLNEESVYNMCPLNALDEIFGRAPVPMLVIEAAPEEVNSNPEEDENSVFDVETSHEIGTSTDSEEPAPRTSKIYRAPTKDTVTSVPFNVVHRPTLNTNEDIDPRNRAESLDSDDASSRMFLKTETMESSAGTYQLGIENTMPENGNLVYLSSDCIVCQELYNGQCKCTDSKSNTNKANKVKFQSNSENDENNSVSGTNGTSGTSTNDLIQQLMNKIVEMDKKMSK